MILLHVLSLVALFTMKKHVYLIHGERIRNVFSIHVFEILFFIATVYSTILRNKNQSEESQLMQYPECLISNETILPPSSCRFDEEEEEEGGGRRAEQEEEDDEDEDEDEEDDDEEEDAERERYG